jgi:hypothetical protein
MDIVKAPFTRERVGQLNWWQANKYVHSYTCGSTECRSDLVATIEGWVCPNCDYTQGWALDFTPMQKREYKNDS